MKLNTKAVKALFLLAAITSITVVGCKLHFTPEPVVYKTVSTASAAINNGKHLTILICGPCHYNEATMQLTGKQLLDIPGFAGKVVSSNITNDSLRGIGRYSDGELAYLIRTGVSREGHLMPYMQRPNLSTKDLDAIIAFLGSNDELVKSSSVQAGKTKCMKFPSLHRIK